MTDCCSKTDCSGGNGPLAWFDNMIGNCYEYATKAKKAGHGIVGIMCEFTPREIIMAAGAVPICLCGGSAETISAAEQQLPANLCPLIKSTYGYHVQGTNPFLDMADLIVAETTCDGKKKMYELLAENRPMYVLELPQKADGSDAMAHWLAELRKFRSYVVEKFGIDVTNEKLLEAIKKMNRERQLRRKLAETMRADVPPFTGRQLLKLKSSISGIEADFKQYEKVLGFSEDKTKAECGSKPVRVLLTGVPVVHGAEKVVDIIEDSGGLIVCMENCTGLKPILEDVNEKADDPLVSIAEKYFHLPCSVMTRNDRRLDILRKLAVEYRVDCIVDLVWQACLTYDVESHLVRRLAEDELGIGFLKIETDYSPSDTARIKVRIEALFETIEGKG